MTGARQTGKTTLSRSTWDSFAYLNLDAVEDRLALRELPTRAWSATVGPAVIDEAQKEPGVFDKVKFAFDAGELDFTALLGSSRFLLMARVRESLAGRAILYELWPLMASELATGLDMEPVAPLLDQLLQGEGHIGALLAAQAPLLLGEAAHRGQQAVSHLMNWGGMPALLPLEDAHRREWLRSYQQTFLERDLSDLVRLSDLAPFRSLQRLAMLRSGGLLNYADLARAPRVAPPPARRYLEYLSLSDQILLLPPEHRNLTSSVVKAPRLYWTDLGLLRHGTVQWGAPTGQMFEAVVVTEVHKWVSTLGRDARLSFYRTRSGFEVDLLITTATGVIGLEIKHRPRCSPKDIGPLRKLAGALGADWRGGVVVTTGNEVRVLDEDRAIWQVGLERLLV